MQKSHADRGLRRPSPFVLHFSTAVMCCLGAIGSGAILLSRFTHRPEVMDAALGGVVLTLGVAAAVFLIAERRNKDVKNPPAVDPRLGLTAAQLERLRADRTKAWRTVLTLQNMLASVQEEERRRIARELHDSTLNHLAAVGLNLMRFNSIVPLSEEGAAVLSQAKMALQSAGKELRVFTYLMHPPSLETDGLKKTVRQFVDGFAQRTGIDIRFRVAASVDAIPYEMKRCMFRILQETLSNVHRHAKASEVQIFLTLKRGHFVLIVNDNGQGFRSAQPEHICLGVGIPGMRTRLKQLGGDLQIKRRGATTSVRAFAPVLGRPQLGHQRWKQDDGPHNAFALQ